MKKEPNLRLGFSLVIIAALLLFALIPVYKSSQYSRDPNVIWYFLGWILFSSISGITLSMVSLKQLRVGTASFILKIAAYLIIAAFGSLLFLTALFSLIALL